MIEYNENISYEILDDGYNIYNDGVIWVRQYEPFAKLYIKDGTYEENCIEHIKEILTPVEFNNSFGISSDLYNSIIDDYTEQLYEEGALA